MGGGAPLSGLGFTEVVPAADALGAGGPEAVQADGGGGQEALGEEDAGVPHADLQAAAGRRPSGTVKQNWGAGLG